MSDNRNYSVITNFGCHWQCPYCIVRNTGIQIAETRMGATYDTVMDLPDWLLKATTDKETSMSDKVRVGATTIKFDVVACGMTQATARVKVPIYVDGGDDIGNHMSGVVSARVPDDFDKRVEHAFQAFADTLEASFKEESTDVQQKA